MLTDCGGEFAGSGKVVVDPEYFADSSDEEDQKDEASDDSESSSEDSSDTDDPDDPLEDPIHITAADTRLWLSQLPESADRAVQLGAA